MAENLLALPFIPVFSVSGALTEPASPAQNALLDILREGYEVKAAYTVGTISQASYLVLHNRGQTAICMMSQRYQYSVNIDIRNEIIGKDKTVDLTHENETASPPLS